MGLWIGLSSLSVAEILEFVLRAALSQWRNCKRKKQIAMASGASEVGPEMASGASEVGPELSLGSSNVELKSMAKVAGNHSMAFRRPESSRQLTPIDT